MSLSPTVDVDTEGARGAQLSVRRPASHTPVWYRRTRLLLAVWAVLSVFWIGSVGYEIYQQVSMQADMSRDVERDLDQGFVNASLGTQASQPVSQTQSLTGILMTYIRFGSDEMAATIFGPPLGLLIFGFGAAFALRRRSRGAEAPLRG